MAILRTKTRLLSSSAPPPTPVPTAKGSRSAAVDDEILSEYLGKTLQIPDLTLPESYTQVSVKRRSPVEVNFSCLHEADSRSKVLKSVEEFGVFQIIGHEISVEELELIFEEAEWVLENPKEERGLDENRESLFWFRSKEAYVENFQGKIVPERYRKFRQKMKDIYGRLENVSNNVGQILLQDTKMLHTDRKQEDTEAVLCLHRNNTDHLLPSDGQDEKEFEVSGHALSLYLTNEDHEFHVQSSRGLISSHIRKGTILVVVRKQLEDWSQGRFKSISGEPVFESGGTKESPSYLLKFMCSPATPPTQHLHQIPKRITIYDQILIAIFAFLLYKFLKYIW